NDPNHFNDTLVLLWRDQDNQPHVREFPVTTEPGSRDFGANASSSLKPNRHYPYLNAWHRGYNALRMGLDSYPVQDDTNNNGHWDDDRNGWRDGGPRDRERLGNAHNIHMASSDLNWRDFPINNWSAGCQVIPGQANWNTFIGHAWTWVNDPVDYYLIDVRDVAPTVWARCATPDGRHRCPFEIRQWPYTHRGDTGLSNEAYYDNYNCSPANESGTEVVYVVNIHETGTLRLDLDVSEADEVDPDLHLLTGDDGQACLTRDDQQITQRVTPGRYVIIVDTWTNNIGVSLPGAYTLSMDFSPD
ncbi:MAG: hypothetical protein VX589_04510, partial [Myxococcota bacterium]|nr:hypothetical protein [Myxococcota bacterium]